MSQDAIIVIAIVIGVVAIVFFLRRFAGFRLGISGGGISADLSAQSKLKAPGAASVNVGAGTEGADVTAHAAGGGNAEVNIARDVKNGKIVAKSGD